jgi:hypothetical protein
MKNFSALSFLILPLMGNTLAQGLEGVRPLSMGEAFRGLADDHGAIDYNPAGLKQSTLYSMEFLYQSQEESDSQIFRGSVIDTLTLPQLGMGFSFSHEENDFTHQKVQIAAATEIASLLFGATLRYVDDKEGGSDWTQDTGILFKPLGPLLGIGVVGHNLAKVDDVSGFPRQYALGLASKLSDRLQLTGDLVWEPESLTEEHWNGHLGGELTLAQVFPIRMGYIFDETHSQRWFTAGLGMLSPKFVLQYGFQTETDSNNQTHSLSLSVPF